MSHNSLENYYKTIFGMVSKHKFSYSEIENMIPFERDIFIRFIMENSNQ
jgi:hypothetical protein